MDYNIGELLDNRYEIIEEIGSGGMAVVYKARCHRLNRFVAVKILRKSLSQEADFRRRFHDESQAVAMLSHPNIVSVYDVSRSSSLEYIVMELIDGITLKQYIQKRGGKLTWREALHFTTQIVKALGHAHSRGIIHRDIKPHNIMVLRDGSVKVADFGIARQMGSQNTLTQEALGSVHYISPEQAKGSHIDARSDLYSVGVVLYEMITGRLPFEGETPVAVAIQHIHAIPLSPREIDDSLPEALEAITMKAMAPSPDKRYHSADEMLVDLEEFRKNPAISFDYNFKDFIGEPGHPEAATQVIDVKKVVSQDHIESRRKQYEQDDEPIREGFPWAILIAVLTILLFTAGLFYFLKVNFFSQMMAERVDYTIPNLLGEVYDTVVSDSERMGAFTLVVSDTVVDESEAGTILSQEPTGDSLVRDPATQITITVSGGPEIIYMIDISDQVFNRATVDLKNLGLDVATPEYVYDDDIPANHIISYSPVADTPMSPGDKVQMVVSLGREEKQVDLINLVGMSQSWAETQITLMNLTVGAVDAKFSDTVPEGEVIEQYPAAYTVVPENSTVNLVVSKGPEITEPVVTETTETVTINIPFNGATVHVQVTMGNQTVYMEDIDTNLNTAITFPVTGSGTQSLSIYFDGMLNNTLSVTFEE